MHTKRNTAGHAKVKIGTILDKGVVDRLKERSAREDKTISSIIEAAVLKYDNEDFLVREMRLKAMDQLFALRFNISDEGWNAITEEDYFEQ